MTAQIDARSLKTWLSDGRELALLDVREHGQYGMGHAFFSVPLPYSRFELGLPTLLPNQAVRVVLCDQGDGVAERAAVRAATLGYQDVHILTGGADGWRQAGCALYAGVNVPSKAFGELVDHQRKTPLISPQDVQVLRDAKADLIIVDGRPFSEFRKMNIPGGICCPNGELALRIKDIAPDPRTKIIVNCAGRTRSIIGAQTLIDLGIDNSVYALENGTQGWFLAGLDLEHGAVRRYSDIARSFDIALQARAREFAERCGVGYVSAAVANTWLSERSRTTYLFDVRTAEEFAAKTAPGFLHAPGGQLIQATDQWVAVRGGRLVVADDELVRAPVVAGWLRQLGYEAYVLDGGIAVAAAFAWSRPIGLPDLVAPATITADDTAQGLRSGSTQLIDLRSSTKFRQGHIAQARWSIRPHLTTVADRKFETIVLIAEERDLAALAAIDLGEAGHHDIRFLAGDVQTWRDAGLAIAATPNYPSDRECIDFLFFVHDRHDGNADAARQYLAWETGLLDQLDEQELGTFRLITGS